jgi:hypothetical protein
LAVAAVERVVDLDGAEVCNVMLEDGYPQEAQREKSPRGVYIANLSNRYM